MHGGDALLRCALGGQMLFFGATIGLALSLGQGFGLAHGLLGAPALRLELGLQGGDALAFGLFCSLAPMLGRDALLRCALGGQVLFFGATLGPALSIGPGFGLARGLLGALALRLEFGLQGRSALTFGFFGGHALSFRLDAFTSQPLFFGLPFSLALRLGPHVGIVLGLRVDAWHIGAAAQHLPAGQQAQARSDQQPKEDFAHEWNVRRKQCGEHRCESAATPRRAPGSMRTSSSNSMPARPPNHAACGAAATRMAYAAAWITVSIRLVSPGQVLDPSTACRS